MYALRKTWKNPESSEDEGESASKNVTLFLSFFLVDLAEDLRKISVNRGFITELQILGKYYINPYYFRRAWV